MTRIFALLLFGFLFMNFQPMNAQEVSATAENDAQVEQNTFNVSDDYNFNAASQYITDEQLEAAKSIDKIDDDNSGFWQKLINSSHFSSDTATKTWIPINKVQE